MPMSKVSVSDQKSITDAISKARLLSGPGEIVLGLEVSEKGYATSPFSVKRSLLREGHVHLRGRTRSGKTSLAIAPMLEQLLVPETRYYSDKNKQQRRLDVKDPVFIFDLGGDLALFNFAKRQADDHDRKFRFLSLDRQEDWHFFDPFQAAGSGGEDRIIRMANLLIQAFHLDYGLIYGGSYYTQRNLSALLRVASRLQDSDAKEKVLNIDDLLFYLKKTGQRDEEEIRFAFQFLAQYDQLKPPPGSEDKQIDLRRAIDDGEVIYFFCPTMGEATTARQIAGLGLYTLINAAMQRIRTRPESERHKPLPHAWVFVDEFQELAGRSFAALLAQSSKFGISLIMANQTTTQLKSRDLDLADVVRDNTHVKVYFTVTGKDDLEGLQVFSKDAKLKLSRTSESMAEFRSKITIGESEQITPTLKKDVILDTSSTHKHCFVILDSGTGHIEPTRVVTDYAIDAEDYIKYKSTPLPRGERDPQGTPRDKPDSTTPLWKRKRQLGVPSGRSADMDAMLDTKRKQEIPEFAASKLQGTTGS